MDTRQKHEWKDGACKRCGEKFTPNGTGPQGKWYTFLIRIFPFNRWVDDISNKHDEDYFEGFNMLHKCDADSRMYQSTIYKIESTWWLRPHWLWKKRAKLNFEAVEEGGDDSFNWFGCEIGVKK